MSDIALQFAVGSVSLAVPLMLASLGETFAENAGMLNLGIEGTMIAGALAGFWGTYISSSPWFGIALAAFWGILISVVVGYICISNTGDQAIAGIAVWVLGIGVTSFLYGSVFPIQVIPPTVHSPPKIPIPFLVQIPILGTALFDQDLLSYLAFLLFPIGYFVMYKTPLGLRLRAVGEDPRAADAAGIGVYKIRYMTMIFGGVMAALGGFYLSTVASNSFFPEMTAGRGFIALAIVILGRWNPFGVLLGALFFGSMLELQFVVAPLGIPLPYEFILLLPYVFTVVFLVLFSRGSSSPGSLGRPYKRSS